MVYDVQEEEEEEKTEDIYQTLQTPPTVVLRKTAGKNEMSGLMQGWISKISLLSLFICSLSRKIIV